MWFSRHHHANLAPAPMPRDVEAIEAVLSALGQADGDALSIQGTIAKVLLVQLKCSFAGVWMPNSSGEFVLKLTFGDLASSVGQTSGSGNYPSFIANTQRTSPSSTMRPILLPTRDAAGVAAPRCESFIRAGAEHGGVLPIVDEGRVVALHEYRSSEPLPFFGGREDKWAALMRVAGRVGRASLDSSLMAETLDDRQAVTTVVSTINKARTADEALRSALETVRSSFGWAYGSFWTLDEDAKVLRFSQESGSAGDEFRQVTLKASFAEGVGLSGRAWKARALVSVVDLGELTDCVRAPAAQRAGVRSGVCFPVMIGTRMLGTMDFFTTETVVISESRAAALRQVQQLVTQRLEILSRSEQDADNARELLLTVDRLREASTDASRVGEGAVKQAQNVTTEVQALSAASAAIGDIIKVISTIAEQTNLLALNATIEAARAGESGKGFAVVAGEVKELARATAEATGKVSQRIADIQASSASVAAGIHATAQTIGELDAVQSRIDDALEQQAHMAAVFSHS